MPLCGNIFYFETKNGKYGKTPVVLLHGAGRSHLDWPLNIRRLGERKVYAPDLPGHGKSAGIGEQSIANYARIVLDWMIDIHVNRVVLIGHSIGGAIALHMALQYTEYVAGLVLISSGARLPVNPELLSRLASPASFPSAVNLITKWSFSPHANKGMLDQFKQGLSKTRPSVVQGDYEACHNFDASESLSGVAVPVCLICGALDKMTPLRYSEYLAENIQGAEMSVVPRAGHMLMLEQPERLQKTIEDFIERMN